MRREKTVTLEILKKEVTLQAPTIGIMERANQKNGELAQAIFIVASCSNMSEQEVKALDTLDWSILQKVLSDFQKEAEKKLEDQKEQQE